MNGFLEFVFEVVIQGALSVPVAFCRWLLSGRKMTWKQFFVNSDIQTDAYIALALIAATILLIKFVF